MVLYLFSFFQDHFFMVLFLICTEEERSGCRNRFAFNGATSEVQLFGAVDVLAHLSCRRSSNSPARNVGLQKGKKYCGGQGTVNWRASSYPGFIQNYWVSTSSYLRYQDTAIKSTLVIGYLDLARTKCGFAKRQKVLWSDSREGLREITSAGLEGWLAGT